MNTDNPFDFLKDLEQRTLKGSATLPSLDRVEKEWVGVGFRVGEAKLIAAMSEIKEILDLPEYTPVPGVQSWVVGVANVRGSLLPIMDMKGYLYGDDTKRRRKGRIIVIDYKGFNTGLIVEEVYGMRHFRESDEVKDIPELDASVSCYVERAYKQEEEHWPVFDFNEMAGNERFAHVSL